MKAPAVKRTKIERAHTALERVASRIATMRRRAGPVAAAESHKAYGLLDVMAWRYALALVDGCRVKRARARGGKS